MGGMFNGEYAMPDVETMEFEMDAVVKDDASAGTGTDIDDVDVKCESKDEEVGKGEIRKRSENDGTIGDGTVNGETDDTGSVAAGIDETSTGIDSTGIDVGNDRDEAGVGNDKDEAGVGVAIDVS